MGSVEQRRRLSTLAIVGFIVAIPLPVVGAVFAVILLARGEVGPGLAVLLWSAIVAFLFVASMG